jgi:hypothetical protein
MDTGRAPTSMTLKVIDIQRKSCGLRLCAAASGWRDPA